MKKSTLKKGGIVLLGALAVTGISFALPGASASKVYAPWYASPGDETTISDPAIPEVATDFLKNLKTAATRINIHNHVATMSGAYGNYNSVIDFGEMEDAKLMDGVYVTFQNMDQTDNTNYEKFFNGQHLTLPYTDIMNHEKMYTATTVTIEDSNGNEALGIYQNTKAQTAVDFVYSTKGLSGVEGVDFDIRALGDQKYVNRMIDWKVSCWVYDLAGNYVGEMTNDDVVFTAKNHTINTNLTHSYRTILQTSNGSKWPQGSLDNKIIVVHFYSAQSVADDAVGIPGGEGSKDTEPITVFSDARIRFNRPDVDLTSKLDYFEAGAGRNTSCAPDTLNTTVDFWNSLYVNNYKEGNNIYTSTFDGKARHELKKTDKPYEELAYYELAVKYPFIADKMEISKTDDLTKVSNFKSLTEITGIEIVGTPGVDSMVTYRIPREYFVQKDGVEDQDCISTGRFTYYFAPQEVKKFEKDDYIFATISAEASDTAFVSLSGSSIPTYNELGELHFDEYKDWKTTPISFENLPYFNSFNTKRYEGHMPARHYGELLLANRTKAPKHSTDRYDDDVNTKGWEISFVYTEYMKEHEMVRLEENPEAKVGDILKTYVPGRYLPIIAHGHSYKDYVAWFEANSCIDCVADDAPEVVGNHAVVPVIDCSGNLYDNDKFKIVSVNAIFRYSRGDVNIGDDESKYVNETYTIAPDLTYTTAVARFDKFQFAEPQSLLTKASPAWYTEATMDESEYKYTAQNLMDGKDGAKYEGPIKIYGNNTWVWFSATDQSLLSHAMGALSSEFLKYFEKIDRKDFFFAPYDEWDSYTYESRPHTVKVFASGLKPDADGMATIKIFKEQFSGGESFDDKFYHTNGFVFSAESLDFAKVFVKKGSVVKPIEQYTGDKFGKFIGMSTGDTLIYKIDMDDDYAVQYVEETGLDMIVKYVPYNDVNDRAIAQDMWNKCFPAMPNVFNHVAQFGAMTADKKGFNEFYTFGTTNSAMFSTLTSDIKIGSYNSFYPFVLNQFGPEHKPTSQIIYNEIFRKDYKTRYVNTCYPVRDGQFIVAGLNIVDPVDMQVFSNKENAFKYDIMVLNDLNGEAYGSVDTVEVNGVKVAQIAPNKYGEVLALVSATFDPKDRDGIVMSKDTITNGEEKGIWARYYAKDTIQLAPQQHIADVEDANRVRFFNLNDYKHIGTFDDKKWAHYGIFAPYGTEVTDTLTAGIKGDVKVPEVWFSSDAEGKKVIEGFQFGVVNAGASKDSVIYIQGRDLPHYGTTSIESEDKIEQKISLISTSDMFTFGKDKTKDLYVREHSMKLAKEGVDTLAYVYKGGENDLIKDVMRGDVVAKIDLRSTPNAEDLCDVENVLSLAAVCDVNKDLNVAFTAGLANPTIKTPVYGEIGGSDAKFNWEAVPGAEYYKVAVGRFNPKFTSEDIFISEVRADNESKTIWVELFNGTGNVIHRDNQVNYWLEVIKEYKENGVAKKDTSIVGVDNFSLQGNLDPEDRFAWSYKPIAHQMDDMDLTTDANNTVKYTIRLMEGFQTDKHQIDIYLFDTPETWMVRKPVAGMPINKGEFYTGNWRTEVGSLPNAYYEWQDEINFDGEESFDIASTSTSIQVHNLIPQTAYTVRVQAYNKCVGDADKMIPSDDYLDFATSKTATSTGDIYFDNADVNDPSVGNENIDAAAIRAIGGKGQVTILNAAGKKAVIVNVLGQVVANTVIGSDNATFQAPAGMVVVSLEDGTVLKAMIK